MNLTDFTLRAMEENGALNYLHAKYLSYVSYEGRKANLPFCNPESLLFSGEELDKPSFLIANDLVILYLLSFGFDNTINSLQAENSENHGFENFMINETPPELQLGQTDTPILDMIHIHKERLKMLQEQQKRQKYRSPPKSNQNQQNPSPQPQKQQQAQKQPQKPVNNVFQIPVPKIEQPQKLPIINKQQSEVEEESDSPFNTEFGPPPISRTQASSGSDTIDLSADFQTNTSYPNSPHPQYPNVPLLTVIPVKPSAPSPKSPHSMSSLDDDIGDD